MEILTFEKKHNELIRKHIIEVCCKECGFDEFEEAFARKDYGDYVNQGGEFYLVIDQEKVVATIGFMKLDESTCGLEGFYINNKYRGCGISKELMNKVIENAKIRNFSKIELSTYERLERAIKFYENIRIQKNDT